MPLLIILLILFGVPYLELSVLVAVGGKIGTFPTVALSIGTAVVGVAIARLQGLAVLREMQDCARSGKPPMAEMIHGFFLFFAGMLLLFPGFITDSLGALLLIPLVRTFLGRVLVGRVIFAHGRQPGERGTGRETLIEGEFSVVTGKDDEDEPEEPGRGGV